MKKRTMFFAAAALSAALTMTTLPAIAADSSAAAATEAVEEKKTEEKTAEEKKANVFTTEDGVLSITLPNDSWAEVTDPLKWVVLSDGKNKITADHYSNGEKLPEISVADSHYVDVYQAAFSTQNEVFIITGSVADSEDIADVCNAIMSVKVLKYDTKKAIKADSVKASDFSVRPMDEVYYVTAESLNVRRGCSTDDTILGTLEYGDRVQVNGAVQKDGQDFGWYQIDFSGRTGYVSAKFLSKNKPETQNQKPQKAEPKKADVDDDDDDDEYYNTGYAMTLYDADGDGVTVYQGSDGNWYDNYGHVYYEINDDGRFQRDDGEMFTSYRPSNPTGPEPTGFQFTVFWENGNTTTLTEFTDGAYYTPDMTKYHSNGDGTFTGEDGTTLYEDDPHPGTYDVDDDDDDVYEYDVDDDDDDVYEAAYDDTYEDNDDTYVYVDDDYE